MEQETITVQEAWEAAGGNPGIKATKEELLQNLKLLDEVCDEAADRVPVAIMFITDHGEPWPLPWPSEIAQRWMSVGKKGDWLYK